MVNLDLILKGIKDYKIQFLAFSIFINTFVFGYFMHGFFFGFKALDLSQILISISIGIFLSLPILLYSFSVISLHLLEVKRRSTKEKLETTSILLENLEKITILSLYISSFIAVIIVYYSFDIWYASGFKNLISLGFNNFISYETSKLLLGTNYGITYLLLIPILIIILIIIIYITIKIGTYILKKLSLK